MTIILVQKYLNHSFLQILIKLWQFDYIIMNIFRSNLGNFTSGLLSYALIIISQLELFNYSEKSVESYKFVFQSINVL